MLDVEREEWYHVHRWERHFDRFGQILFYRCGVPGCAAEINFTERREIYDIEREIVEKRRSA